jgi:hypothetical protein
MGGGKLCFREFFTAAAMKVPANAGGVEIYSLQGKRLLRYRFEGFWKAQNFKALQAMALPEVFVVRYFTR